MDEDRIAVKIHGDLEFAEASKVATLRDTIWEIDEKDRERLETNLMRAGNRLEYARNNGNQEQIDYAEEKYQKAVAEWLEFSEAEKFAEQHEGRELEMSHTLEQPTGSREVGELPLRDALSFDAWKKRQLDDEEIQARLEAWEVFCSYVFQGGAIRNPWLAFKHFLAAVRRASPSYLNGISQTELALILKETKASPSAREKKVVEEIMKRFKMLGYHLLGDTKSETTRARCSKAQRGNGNRRKAKRGKKR